MNGSHLRTIAAEYAAQGLSTIVAFLRSKVPLVEWKAYQYEPPSTCEREAMFAFEDHQLNIGVVCGAASNNLAIIDTESKRAFEVSCDGLMTAYGRRIVPLVYEKLHRLAHRYMRRERRPAHTLQTTALVHEAYMCLVDAENLHWQNRAHFLPYRLG
jgi:ECF sigma factor